MAEDTSTRCQKRQDAPSQGFSLLMERLGQQDASGQREHPRAGRAGQRQGITGRCWILHARTDLNSLGVAAPQLGDAGRLSSSRLLTSHLQSWLWAWALLPDPPGLPLLTVSGTDVATAGPRGNGSARHSEQRGQDRAPPAASRSHTQLEAQLPAWAPGQRWQFLTSTFHPCRVRGPPVLLRSAPALTTSVNPHAFCAWAIGVSEVVCG